MKSGNEGGDWRAKCPGRVATEDQFVEFLDAVGVCLWKPLARTNMPNLTEMMDVPSNKVMEVTWFWKDDLHEQKRLFYGKLFGGNASFVSMRFLPAVIAAHGDVDPHNLHEEGRLTDSALRIYETLKEHHDLPTRDLRHHARLSGTSDKKLFDDAILSLSALFLVCKVGITGRTRGTYSYRWGLVEDWIPETLSEAAKLRPLEAAVSVVNHLNGLKAGLTPEHWRRLFGWNKETLEHVRQTASRL